MSDWKDKLLHEPVGELVVFSDDEMAAMPKLVRNELLLEARARIATLEGALSELVEAWSECESAPPYPGMADEAWAKFDEAMVAARAVLGASTTPEGCEHFSASGVHPGVWPQTRWRCDVCSYEWDEPAASTTPED